MYNDMGQGKITAPSDDSNGSIQRNTFDFVCFLGGTLHLHNFPNEDITRNTKYHVTIYLIKKSLFSFKTYYEKQCKTLFFFFL